MKQILNIKMLLMMFAFAAGCEENTGGNNRQFSRNDGSRKGEVTAQQANDSIKKDALIDQVNYTIISFALKDTAVALTKFIEATKDNKSYQAIDSVLDTMNLAKTVLLSKEINGLKKDDELQKKTDSLWPVYLSKKIFEDTARYKKIYAFYKSRTADSAALANLQSVLQSEVAKRIQEMGQKLSPNPENSLPDIILLISVGLLAVAIAAAGIITWKKNKKKAEIKATQPVTDSNTQSHSNTAEQRNNLLAENDTLKMQNNKLKEDNEALRKQLQALSDKVQAGSIAQQPRAQTETPAALYFPAPANNNFPHAAGSSSKRSLDAYQLEIEGSKALCKIITEDRDVEKRALDSPDIYILPLYEITPESAQFGRATSIKILEPCTLQKDGNQWTLKAKGLVKLS